MLSLCRATSSCQMANFPSFRSSLSSKGIFAPANRINTKRGEEEAKSEKHPILAAAAPPDEDSVISQRRGLFTPSHQRNFSARQVSRRIFPTSLGRAIAKPGRYSYSNLPASFDSLIPISCKSTSPQSDASAYVFLKCQHFIAPVYLSET